jgi:hypothetical protein
MKQTTNADATTSKPSTIGMSNWELLKAQMKKVETNGKIIQ